MAETAVWRHLKALWGRTRSHLAQSPVASQEPPETTPKRVMLDGSPIISEKLAIDPVSGQQKSYVILANESRTEFQRPVRNRYIHEKCENVTTIAREIAETFAVDPKFYTNTFCAHCRQHFRVSEFRWHGTDEIVGS